MRFLAKGMSSKKWCTFGEAWSGDGDEKKGCFGSGLGGWTGSVTRMRHVSGRRMKCEEFLNAPAKETNPLSNPALLIQVNG
jgi:hypothetical protein